MNFYVYAHLEADTGRPFYVGKGKGSRAWQDGSRRSRFWQAVADKHGRSVVVLQDGLDEELAFLGEVELIDKYRRLGFRLANMTSGGEGAVLTDEAAKQRHRDGNSRAWTEQRRAVHAEKVSAALKGRQFTDEHRSHLSSARSGYTMKQEQREKIGAANRGRPLSEAHKQKLREVFADPEIKQKLLARRPRDGRKVQCIETGQVFDSAPAAAAWLQSNGIAAKREGIKDAAGGRQKTAFGYSWRYA